MLRDKMEKKNVKDKRLLRIYLFTCICLLLIMAAITRYEYNKYVNNNNDAIVRIVDCIKDKYTDLAFALGIIKYCLLINLFFTRLLM